jgi:hypothetical protein
VIGWPFDSMAARGRAGQALSQGNGTVALNLARRALRSDPLDADVIGMIGQAA